MRLLTVFLLACLSIQITGCTSTNIETLSPEKSSQYFLVKPVSVNSSGKTPIIFFLQGSGGNSYNAQKWAPWFASHGVASVFIDSAGLRNRKNLFGVNYGKDIAAALNAVKSDPQLDLSRYAAMGFSRGGTGALESGSFLKTTQQKPDFIFSLYPGDQSRCPNSYRESSQVYVFYGAKDDWGTYQGNRGACKRMASKYENTTFVLLDNAHHGYDGNWSGTWKCCGGRKFTSKPDTEALGRTKATILRAMNSKWF